jgi:pyruvate/2-oxoglutarate dehydrogenase complex dihydrolipoamide dehydrogenase (E3) component
MSRTTDVIIVGVGTCGEDIALRLLASGLDVIGIEARLVGGECAYFACLPTKSMVRSAGLLTEAKRADGYVGQVTVQPDWSLVARRVRDEVTGGWNDAGAAARFHARGGQLVRGRGRLVDNRTVAVGEDTWTARRGIVLATGSRPWLPPVDGLADVGAWTTRDAVKADPLPTSLLVLGAGAVGCEFSQVFARFGVDVTLIEARERVLPAEEPEVAEPVTAALEADGATVRCGVRVTEVARTDARVRAVLDDGAVVEADEVLAATGRRVDVSELGLDAAGVEVANGAIVVDEHLRAAEGIWAVGDVTGIGMLTHVALSQASIAVADILGHPPPAADYRAVPHVTFTDPEVGSVGLGEEAARAAGIDVDVVVKSLPATFRGWLHGPGNAGFVKLVADRRADRLVGATVVGPRAGEMLGMLIAAVHAEMSLGDLVTMVYPFPTFVGSIGEALGAYGRGLVTVLDPGNPPMFTD